jgi:hypothetical protein
MSKSKSKRAQAVLPHQGMRTLSCHAWFSSPRGNDINKKNRREQAHLRRISHGIMRSIEGL